MIAALLAAAAVICLGLLQAALLLIHGFLAAFQRFFLLRQSSL